MALSNALLRAMSCASPIALMAGLGVMAPAGPAAAADRGPPHEVQQLVVTAREQVIETVKTPRQVFVEPSTIRVTDAAKMQLLGPNVGGAQGFGLNPGAYVNGYGTTGATKYTVALDGVGQGWGGYGGYTGGGSLMVTLDGVPIVDPGTGLWSSAAFPSLSMFQAQQVTYGPGPAAERWYNNIGGDIEYTPLQPTHEPGAVFSTTFGSFGETMTDLSLQSGQHDGWSAVLAGSYGQSDSYRRSPDGFNSKSTDYVVFAKAVKTFERGHVSFGGYFARGAGYRPQVIPVEANPDITMNGDTFNAAGQLVPVAGQLYSQKTSGFYSALPYANYEKYDINELAVGYSKLALDLDATTRLKNLAYYTYERRFHIRHNDAFLPNATQFGPYSPATAQYYSKNTEEYNWPHHWWFGDKISLTKTWGINTIDVGAWAQDSEYNTRQSFFNPLMGGSIDLPTGKYRYGYWRQIDTGLFIQDGLRPLPNLLIQPGLRLANFWINYSDGAPQDVPAAYAAFPGHNQGALGNGLPPYQRRRFSALEPSIEANYRPAPWLMIYASYEEAYKTPQVGGGGGLYQAIDSAYAHLAKAREYQAGFKVLIDEPEDGLGRFDLGANYFHLDYDKQTISTALADGTSATTFGSSYYEGVNLFADDEPWKQLRLFTNLSFVRAIYSSYYTGPIGSDGGPAPGITPQNSPSLFYDGSHVPYVPNATFNLGADYRFDLGGAIFDPYVLFQYTGDQYIFDNVTVAPSSQKLSSYSTLNVGFHADVPVTLAGATRTVTLSLAVQNLTDKRYNQYLFISSGGYFNTSAIDPNNMGYELAYPGAPRTIYGSIGLAF